VQTLLDAEDLERLRKWLPPGPSARTAAQAQAAAPVVLPVTASPTVLPSVTGAEALQAERPPLDLRMVPLIWAPSTLMVDAPGKVGPGDDEVDAGETVIDGLMGLMLQAQREVLIMSPYFVPGERMTAVYQQLRSRGVRVRVLTNSLASNDAPAAHAGYARHRERLLAMGVELHEMRSDPETAAELLGSSGSRRGSAGGWFGSAGGSKAAPNSRASLHSKAVIIDQRWSVIGSMNLDLRSQLQNSEVALVIRGQPLAQVATRQIENTLATAAYRVEQREGALHWRAPASASFSDETEEPGASAKLKLLVRVIGPFAPDEML
jgi:putative cardiolipin synthase